MELLPDITKKITSDVLTAMAEIQQSRSNFQIEKFVINQHDTDEMRYQQTVIEIQSLYYTIKTVSLELKKTQIEIDRLRATNDEIDELNAQIKELGLEQTRLIGIGAFRELDCLLKIYNSFLIKFTREQIENRQLDYWNKRLEKQSLLEAIGGSQNQASNLNSLHQIGAIEITSTGIQEIDNQKELL